MDTVIKPFLVQQHWWNYPVWVGSPLMLATPLPQCRWCRSASLAVEDNTIIATSVSTTPVVPSMGSAVADAEILPLFLFLPFPIFLVRSLNAAIQRFTHSFFLLSFYRTIAFFLSAFFSLYPTLDFFSFYTFHSISLFMDVDVENKIYINNIKILIAKIKNTK